MPPDACEVGVEEVESDDEVEVEEGEVVSTGRRVSTMNR